MIWTGKEAKGKPHLTSNHGKLGAIVMVGNLGLAVFGMIGLNPDFGIFRTNKLVRFVHKYSGKAIIAASWVTCVLGFIPMSNGNMGYQLGFGIPLAILGLFVLL